MPNYFPVPAALRRNLDAVSLSQGIIDHQINIAEAAKGNKTDKTTNRVRVPDGFLHGQMPISGSIVGARFATGRPIDLISHGARSTLRDIATAIMAAT